jgi:hypothetical protein
MDSEKAFKELKDKKVPMQSVLSVKEPIDDQDEKGKYGKSYKGPFYIDIDVDGEPEQAVESAQAFADKLEANDVHEYAVYLSGKKGFHFIIPMETFAAARPVKSLPLIYKEMAMELYVEGVDLAVYNEGRPRLLRTANVKRPDNGKYKVPISQKELYEMTPGMYAELTTSPRAELPMGTPKLSLKMQSLYEMAKSRMQKKQKSLADLEFVPDEDMVKTLGEGGKLPGCIQILIEKGDTKSGSNFNQAAIQFAAFMVKANVKDWMTHARAMAHNVKSSSYKTDEARLTEIKKLVNYVAGTKQYGFSKAMLFSVMEPCRDCAICNGTVTDGEAAPEDHEFFSDISETPHGYIIGYGKNQRNLTTFTLEIISKFSMVPEDEEEGETRVGTNAIIRINGHRRERVTVLEDAWDSVRGFKQVIKGKGNLAFYGNDLDLQKLKHKLFADESNMTEISYVHSVGIHRHKIGGRTILVYVEPGFSVSSTKERDTHQIWGSIPACPDIRVAAYPEPDDDLKEFIDKMLHCNDPLVTCTLIGWMALCHVKVQLTMRDNQFPIINLWGNAGCVDRDTEFLTPAGWKKIADYSEGDKVAQWFEDGSIEFVKPDDYIVAPADALNRIKTSTVDMVVSDNHRMPYYTSKGNFAVKEFSELSNLRAPAVPRGFTVKSDKGIKLSDELIRVLVMQAADGYIDKRRKRQVFYINVKRPEKRRRVGRLLKAAGIPYTVNKSAPGYQRFRYYAPKSINTKSLQELWGCSRRQLKVVYSELTKWDSSSDSRTGLPVFCGNEANSDLAQYVFSAVSGDYASKSLDCRQYVNGPLYTVGQSTRSRSTIEFNAKSPKVTPYPTKDGLQYCFTTPSSFWLARRNGKIFPTGNSGKSAISSLFVYLHGVDYMLEHSPMSLQGTTPWAVAQYCTTSESTPRLIEEFNRGEMPTSKYDQFSGMFKAAWNKQTFAKGGIENHTVGGATRTGAKVIESQISAPLCVMSEQAPERPALRQRMIQLNVKKAGRELPQAEENFYHVIDNKSRMTSLARAMVWESLDTHPEWVADTMESFRASIPREIDARPRFSYQAVLTGIKFFGKTLTSIGLDEDYVNETIKFMMDTVTDNLENTLDEVRIEKSRTEVSLVVSEMAIMADMEDAQVQWSLVGDEHYIRTPEFLYLDTAICHTLYTRWSRSSNSKIIIGSLQQFEALLQQEDFFVELCTHGAIDEGTRRLAKLSVERLRERGIDVNRFKESMFE